MEEFLARWAGLVRAHEAAAPRERAAILRSVLDDGLPDEVDGGPPLPLDDPARLRCEAALVEASGVLDAFGYFRRNPDLAWHLDGGPEELRHFVTEGWRDLRHPSPVIDLWWYWSTYLDPTRESVNPVVHYLAEGRHRGLEPLPPVLTRSEPPEPLGPSPRRVCLFAGFDADGMVDDTVVAYVAELSRFADVYYLADCPLEEGELDKLAPHTRGAWAIRHGRYDFGSYAMLATELVGWEVLEGYDELLLANDSCYLVQPLDRVFERMDARACDWWGLQATHESFTQGAMEHRGGPLPLQDVVEEMRAEPLWRIHDSIHVGSYFLAYRRPVLRDPGFRARIEAVAAQSDKRHIITKYEIGLSRYLLLAGFALDTFVDGIWAYHPVYRGSAFDLVADGFPLLKRQFVYENPFRAPDLRLWKERLLAVAPDADVAAIERNLYRVAPLWSLKQSFETRSRPDGTVALPSPVGPEEFHDEDEGTPKHPHWWTFAVDPRTGTLPGDLRAVFEAVRDDPTVKKIVLTGDVRLRLSGANVVLERMESAPGQTYAMRSASILVPQGPRRAVNHPFLPHLHRYVDVGDPWGASWDDPDGLSPEAAHDLDLTRAVVVADDTVASRAEQRFRRLDRGGPWITGAPVLDLLLGREDRLAADLRASLDGLRDRTAGRRLVVLAPPLGGAGPADGHLAALAALAAWARSEDVVLGLRPSSPLHAAAELAALAGAESVDLSPERLPCLEMAGRLAHAVVSGEPADVAALRAAGRRVAAWPADGLLDVVREVLASDPAPARAVRPGAGRRVVRALKATYLPLEEWAVGDGTGA